MEANFFRFLASELGEFLSGRRVDKVFSPAPDVWTLKVRNTGAPLHVLFRPAKSAGHLFLSAAKPANPANAPARAMWFRKRLQGRLLFRHFVDWPNLRLAFELSPRSDPKDSGAYLVFDVRNGLFLCDELEPEFLASVEWPAFEDAVHDPEVWREYPHISPPLRKALASLPGKDSHSLYLNVVGGMADAFYLACAGNAWKPPLAWPLGHNPGEVFSSAVDAANAYGERTLFPLLEMEEERPEQIQRKRERRKILRNLQRLDQEEERLDRFSANKMLAEALQANLYRLKKLDGLETVDVEHPNGDLMTVPLNPLLSMTENMEKYFKLADKAERGRPHIERRREEMRERLERVENGELSGYEEHSPAFSPAGPVMPKRYKGLAVSLFRSSDGFTIIRGRSKKANHEMLSKAASPFDYWFHVSDGPSSHVILKRDHPGQDVPEQTLREAATLCGLKSFRRDDGKAEIMFALVKDVRKVKGYDHGQVAVDKVAGTVLAVLDPEVEERLQ
ncbi:NFACT RNA binding domain-containing protein [Pseudodesulfovibrio tunisiensis]|uniref:NFACT RNA binding domain-containing protein n=1 Tax=Pseudodesulfovibrio tunisiensis TaxID=463192 RepID=UPI001FB563DA|nr:NFACT RNA binding domain-containing protein [Pseudodesulfovibrio tunisiensis]